jgi:ParB family chromosome partitioning protein
MDSDPHKPIEIDLHRLELRFAGARISDPPSVRRLTQSLQAHGQQRAITVVPDAEALVLLDGYRRVEALRQLGRDTALAEVWAGSVAEGLLQVMRQHQARAWQAIEEGWLMASLVDGGLSQERIARALGKDKSWVSRRLALVSELPESLQQAVRAGELSSWAANRIVLPLARANADDAHALLAAIRRQPLSTRALSTWFAHYQKANSVQRARLVEQPHLFVKTLQEQQERSADQHLAEGPQGQWLADLHSLERVLKRLLRTLPQVFDPAQGHERLATLRAAFDHAAALFERLRRRLEQANDHRGETTERARAASAGDQPARDQPSDGDLAQQCTPDPAPEPPRAQRADPEVAERCLAAARALLAGEGQCGAHPGAGPGAAQPGDSLQHPDLSDPHPGAAHPDPDPQRDLHLRPG